MLDNDRRLRFVSVENCMELGHGAHGRVYRLNDEQILKVYTDDSTFSAIDRERLYGRSAFLEGLPSAITFDTVVTEYGCGVIFEMVNGEPLGSYISSHPEEMDELATRYADLLKSIHTTKADTGVFKNSKEILIHAYEAASEKYFSRKQKDALISIVNAVPDQATFVHNDFHPQNIMINDKKEMMIIDMAEISYGHGIFDLGSMYMSLVFSGRLSDKLCRSVTGLSGAQAKHVWDVLIRRYFDTNDEKLIREIERQCAIMKDLRLANLISTTNTFPAAALWADSLWAKYFLIRKKDACIRTFENLK